MSVQIIVPSLGESIREATIAKWYKKIGEQVKLDEILLELETDKVTLEVNAPSTGILAEIKASTNDIVSVGQLLGTITAGSGLEQNINSGISDAVSVPEAIINNQVSSKSNISSPSASKIAADNNIALDSIVGTGKDSRITKEDVLNKLANNNQQVKAIAQDSHIVASQTNREEKIKMTRLRKTIAQRLKDSQNTAAILTTFNEINMSEIMRIRKIYQEKFLAKHGVKLGFMSLFVKAVVQALKEIPAVNAEIEEDYIIYKNYYDIGVAVGTDQGLVVPIVRNADQLSLAQIEKSIGELGKKAKEGKLSISEMTGGTFSVTNGGIYGSLLSTPIINPPQSGILGMHNIVERPIAKSGAVVIMPMMYVALSYDHRLIDGKEAVTFLLRIKEMVENPEKILLDI